MFFILSDILHSLPIPNMSWYMALEGHGYPLHGLSSVHGVCGVFRIVWFCPIAVMIMSHRYYTPIVVYFQCGSCHSVPLCYGIVGDIETSPTDFHRSVGYHTTHCALWHGGRVS